MKKVFLILVVLTAFTAGLSAQSFEKGNHGINVGLGFGHMYYGGWGGGYYGSLPVISGSYELGIVEVPMGSDLTGVVSVGGIMAFTGGRYGKWDNDNYWSYTVFTLAARGNYHFIFHDKFDPYAGVLMGFSIWSDRWHGDNAYETGGSSSGGFEAGAYVGARYFFTDMIAVYSEIGYLPAFFNVGVTFKL